MENKCEIGGAGRNEADSVKAETKKVVIEVKNRFTGAVKFTSEKTTIKEACVDNKANLNGANLCGANLNGADLCGANLRGADLCGAELMNAKFYGKGGTTKITKSQVDDFFRALGIVVEN